MLRSQQRQLNGGFDDAGGSWDAECRGFSLLNPGQPKGEKDKSTEMVVGEKISKNVKVPCKHWRVLEQHQ